MSEILVTLRFLCDRCDMAIGVRLLERATPKAREWSELERKPRLKCPGCGFDLASLEERKAIGASREGLRRDASNRWMVDSMRHAARPCGTCGHAYGKHDGTKGAGCEGDRGAWDCDCERFTELEQ
jgi:hypothetical protein